MLSKLISFKKILTNPKVLLALFAIIMIACAFWVGRITTTKTKTVIKEMASKTQTQKNAQTQKTINSTTERKSQIIKAETKQKQIITNKNHKQIIRRTIEVTNPKTGKKKTVTEEIETTDTENNQTNTTGTTNINTSTSTSVNTAITTDSNTAINTTNDTHSTITEITHEGPTSSPNNTSRLGIAVNSNAKLMATYDMVKYDKFALAATAEIDTKKVGISAAGASIKKTISKDRYFVGVGAQHNFQNNNQEIIVSIGENF